MQTQCYEIFYHIYHDNRKEKGNMEHGNMGTKAEDQIFKRAL